MISCRLPVQLPEGQPCIVKHQAEDCPFISWADNVTHCLYRCVRRLGQASPCRGGHQITVTDFGLAEVDVAKRYSAALCQARFWRWLSPN